MIEVLKSGLFDTIQDLGRTGYQSFGVPQSGAMDQYASTLANSILGNSLAAAVLEFTLMAPQLKFHSDTVICITGMESGALRNGNPIENNSYVPMVKNDILSFGSRQLGCRGYIAVLGGFQSDEVMESRSFYKLVTSQDRLWAGDQLPILNLNAEISVSNALVKTPDAHFHTQELEVREGVEFKKLNSEQRDQLLTKKFTISKDSNRMAYQLQETLENTLNAIITAPVLPGTVQLTPSGQLMLLMRDCQTTGGYPRILQLSEMSINQLSQKIPGQKFRFKLL